MSLFWSRMMEFSLRRLFDISLIFVSTTFARTTSSFVFSLPPSSG
ncbi:hypothetical protein GBAR_LOCUS29033, partial [Geodia barretti]